MSSKFTTFTVFNFCYFFGQYGKGRRLKCIRWSLPFWNIMTQFYSFHDSATKFATQHIFVCPLNKWSVHLHWVCSLTLINSLSAKQLSSQLLISYGQNSWEKTKMDTSFLPKFSSNTSGLALKLITACSVRAEPQTHIIPSEQPWEQWRSSCSNGSCSEQQVPPWPLHESIQDPETQRKSRTETIRHSLGLWKLEIYAAVRFLRGGGWYTWHLVGDGCPPSLFPGFPIPASQLEPGTAPQGTSTRHPNPHHTHDSSIPCASLAPAPPHCLQGHRDSTKSQTRQPRYLVKNKTHFDNKQLPP